MANRVQVRLKSAGMKELLNDPRIGDHLESLLQPALAAAKSSAPVVTGHYQRSLSTSQVTTDRIGARLSSDADYAMDVEAKHGVLARALDSAG